MCGINGFNWNDRKIISLMNKELNHRGPDDNGIYLNENLSLGHTRLSIIDLSSAGHQPMNDEFKEIIIVFNGEIYNYKEIKNELKEFNFKSKTDTEVLIYGYKKWGLDKLLNKLDGIFSFCIYDKKKKNIYLIRDFTGVKPLYYYFNDNKFCFSSEIKSILKNNKIKKELNKKQLAMILFHHFTTGNETTFKNIFKILPGHYLKFDLNKKKITKIKQYWEINNNIKKLTKKEVSNKLKNIIEETVKKQLISDVEIGSFLSGGLDSTAITCIAQKNMNKPINTFSVGFDKEVENELKWAKLVSEKIKSKHHECIITGKKVNKEIEKILESYDEPMLDPGTIPNFFVSKLAKEHGIKVVLAGEGSDELFGGYGQFKQLPKINFFSKIPKIFKMPFLIYHFLNTNLKHKKTLYILYNSYSNGSLFALTQSWFSHHDINNLLNQKYNIKELSEDYDKYFKKKNMNYLNKLSYVFQKIILSENYNMKADKMTMSQSIEERVPFQSKKLIEFSFTIEPKIKFKFEKEILKQAVQNIIPKKILNRKKRGYGTPIEKWVTIDLKNKILKTMKKSKLVEDEIFNKEFIEFYLNNIEKKGRFAYRNFALYSCEIWYKKYFYKN